MLVLHEIKENKKARKVLNDKSIRRILIKKSRRIYSLGSEYYEISNTYEKLKRRTISTNQLVHSAAEKGLKIAIKILKYKKAIKLHPLNKKLNYALMQKETAKIDCM